MTWQGYSRERAIEVEDNDIDCVVVTMTCLRCNYDRAFQLSQSLPVMQCFFLHRFLHSLLLRSHRFSLSCPFYRPTHFNHYEWMYEWAVRVTTKSHEVMTMKSTKIDRDRQEGVKNWPSWRDWPSAMMVSAESIGQHEMSVRRYRDDIRDRS